ncbi:MAG: PAS domain S-box protein [Sideroxydans sp.]
MDSRVKQDRAGTHAYTSLLQDPPFYIQWLILGCALLVLAGVIAQNLHSSREQLETAERERLQERARVVEQNMVRQLGTINLGLDDIRKRMDWWSKQKHGEKFASQYLTSLVHIMPGVRTILITDAHGTVIAANREQIIGQNFAQREYFSTPLHDPKPDTLYISPPFTTVLGVYTLSLSKVIMDKNGRFAGVVSATLAPDEFEVLMNSVRSTPDMWVYLAHGTGPVFMMVPERADMAGKNLALPGTLFTRHMESGQTASIFVGNVHDTGENRLVALHTIQPSTQHLDRPLVVAIARDLATIFAGWQRDAMIHIGLFVVVMLSSVSGLVFFQCRQRVHVAERKRIEKMELSARKKADTLSAAVAKNERFLLALADHLPGMVGYWNRELRCRFANSHYLEWFGKTPEEMKGITMQELMGESLFALNEPYIRKALAGENQQFERTLRKADGSVGHTWAHYISDITENGEVNGFFVLVTDVTPLKKTEIELNRSRAELADLYENAPCGYHSLDAEGRFIRVNRTEADWLGHTRDELIGRKITEFFTPHSIETFAQHFARFKQAGHVENVEAELLGKDGIPFSILLSATAVYDADGNYIMNRAAIIDISERKRVENELREREERYRQLFEKAPIGIVTSKPDLKFISANETFRKMFGYTSDELQHMTIYDLTHPDYLDQTAKLITGMSGAMDSHYLIEKKYMRKDGSIFWGRSVATRLMNEDMRTHYYMGMIEDISEYKEAEDHRRKSDATLRALLDNIPYLIWLKDVDSRVVAVNESFFRTIGRGSMEEVLGKSDFDLWPKDLAEKYRADDIEVMNSRQQKQTVERLLQNGEMRWVETFKAPILDSLGNLIGTTGFAHDITDRIEQEERRLKEVREQRDVLVREVHHRIKNNLQGVVGLLRQHALDYPEMREVIEVTVGRIYSIALIHGMQAQSLSEEVGLYRLIASVIDAAGGGVDYQADMDSPILLNREEAVPIALVLNELVTNACKHRTANTLVVIRLDVVEDGVLITIANHFDDSAQERTSGGQGLNLVKSLLPRKSADLAVTRTENIFTVELKLLPPVTIAMTVES